MKTFIKTYNKEILLLLISLFIWLSLKKIFLSKFDSLIYPFLSKFEFSSITTIIFIIVALFFLYKINLHLKSNYFVTPLATTFFIISLIVYIDVRITSIYLPMPILLWGLGYSDIIMIIIGGIVIQALISYLNPQKIEYDMSVVNTFTIEKPIDDVSNDVLDFNESIIRFIGEIKSFQQTNVFSVGVVGVWGSGKSSYLNLLHNKLEEENSDEFIILKFNPRHSKSPKKIQEDFFNLLFSHLENYDSRFSNSFRNYLKALNVIDSYKIIDFVSLSNKAWDSSDEKEKINNAINRLGKRIIIIIEDLDRLKSDEIIEIFKLIDGNASFNNVIFITAYDKTQLNKIIGKKYSNAATAYSEKFFDYEMALPNYSFDVLYNYFVNQLIKYLNITEDKKVLFINDIQNVRKYLELHLNTFRDIKRFLNLLVTHYKHLHGELDVKDFILLYLIKYKWYDEYLKLYKNKTQLIIRGGLIPDTMFDQYYLMEKVEESYKLHSIDILKCLFERKDKQSRSINNISTFNLYFLESIDEQYSIKRLELLLNKNYILHKDDIVGFVKNNLNNTFKDYLIDKQISSFDSKDTLLNYLFVLFQSVIISQNDYSLNFKLTSFMLTNSLSEVKRLSFISAEDYKKFITENLSGQYPDYLTLFLRGLILDTMDENHLFIANEELKAITLKNLEEFIAKNSIYEQNHLQLLYSCVSDLSKDGNRTITLDKEACKKVQELIKENPKEYIDNFLRLGYQSSTPEVNAVACEPFWKQIFQNEMNMRAFLFDKELNSINSITRVRNFWSLYENNNYEMIEFKNQGNVRLKIDSDLINEKIMLDNLLEIENEVNKFMKRKDNNYTNEINNLRAQIDKIELNLVIKKNILAKILLLEVTSNDL